MRYDYLIVGQGLAGTVLAHTLESSGLSFLIVDADHPETSSKVAAGLMSPITGKRIVKTWKAEEIFPFAQTFYREVEHTLGSQVYFEKRIYKPFQTIEEENDFISKSADVNFSKLLDFEIDTTVYDKVIKKQLGGVDVLQGGNVWSEKLLKLSRDYFTNKKCLNTESFDFSELTIHDDYIQYKEVEAKRVVFCEGHLALDNPYFSWLPFSVTKGEQLYIESADIPEDKIISKGGYILPTGSNHFTLGASYEQSADNTVSEKGRDAIVKRMGEVLASNYTIVNQRAAIRPTVKDRRPLIGVHPEFDRITIFNGMGTKGVTLSPYFANQFINYLEKGEELNTEVNIKRYFSLYTGFKK